jgi:hypothetical protein
MLGNMATHSGLSCRRTIWQAEYLLVVRRHDLALYSEWVGAKPHHQSYPSLHTVADNILTEVII